MFGYPGLDVMFVCQQTWELWIPCALCFDLILVKRSQVSIRSSVSIYGDVLGGIELNEHILPLLSGVLLSKTTQAIAPYDEGLTTSQLHDLYAQ